jgi:hypothetical protein
MDLYRKFPPGKTSINLRKYLIWPAKSKESNRIIIFIQSIQNDIESIF